MTLVKKNESGFSSKELIVALGSILVLCVLAWPAFYYLKGHCALKNKNMPVRTSATLPQTPHPPLPRTAAFPPSLDAQRPVDAHATGAGPNPE